MNKYTNEQVVAINASDLQKLQDTNAALLDALKDVMAQAARHSNEDSAAMFRAKQAIAKAEEK